MIVHITVREVEECSLQIMIDLGPKGRGEDILAKWWGRLFHTEEQLG